jgi:excinuclease UvrABC nuclease subunit
MLVAQIRDEAHRFAITGMRARRASVRTGGSRLEDIPGVGPRKRRGCCNASAACAVCANAGVDDLASWTASRANWPRPSIERFTSGAAARGTMLRCSSRSRHC